MGKLSREEMICRINHTKNVCNVVKHFLSLFAGCFVVWLMFKSSNVEISKIISNTIISFGDSNCKLMLVISVVINFFVALKVYKDNKNNSELNGITKS